MKLGNQVTKVSSPLKELVWPLSGSQAISISYRETCRRSVESGTMTALQLSPDDFRRIAKQVTDLAAEYLESMDSRPISPQATGPAAVTLERTVVGWLADVIGCHGFTGSLTGGGSSANLMGLAMAREAKTPANEKGMSGQGAVYASEEVHMSIPKAVALLGIGRQNLRLIQ